MKKLNYKKSKLFVSFISLLLVVQMMVSPLVNADPLLIDESEETVGISEESLPASDIEESTSDSMSESEMPSDSPSINDSKALSEDPLKDTDLISSEESDPENSDKILQPEASPSNSPIQLLETTEFITQPVDGGLKITDWLGEGTVVVIPDMIDGTSVVAIGRNALQKFGLTEITLGKNIKVVEDYAFADNNITKLTIPVESALEEIGEYAFRDNLLSTFIFPAKLKVLAKGAFSNNNLTSVTSNSVIADIGDIVFEKNKLIEVTLGNSITSFGKSVFLIMDVM